MRTLIRPLARRIALVLPALVATALWLALGPRHREIAQRRSRRERRREGRICPRSVLAATPSAGHHRGHTRRSPCGDRRVRRRPGH
jgi:hypothetical protein